PRFVASRYRQSTLSHARSFHRSPDVYLSSVSGKGTLSNLVLRATVCSSGRANSRIAEQQVGGPSKGITGAVCDTAIVVIRSSVERVADHLSGRLIDVGEAA